MNAQSTSPRNDTLEDSLRDLVSLGRMWAAHGLSMGSQALAASAESLAVTSRLLDTLREQINDVAADELQGTFAEE
jgi:head-tail adaptor